MHNEGQENIRVRELLGDRRAVANGFGSTSTENI